MYKISKIVESKECLHAHKYHMAHDIQEGRGQVYYNKGSLPEAMPRPAGIVVRWFVTSESAHLAAI